MKKTRLSVHRVREILYKDFDSSGAALWWIGQAGFILKYKKTVFIIDAYLSDYLSVKYWGKKYPHRRMMEAPIAPESLEDVSFFISTHSHSDHMDPGIISVIAENNPGCRFILPEAATEIGLSRGIPEDRMILMDDGKEAVLGEGISIRGIASAHEDLQVDLSGHHLFLGYLLSLGDFTIYHSGDCIPYDGLEERLAPFELDLALLPVNGRSSQLSGDGIAGNFNFPEALKLADDLKIPFIIPHHYGMFDFNTVDPDELKSVIANKKSGDRVFPAETGFLYRLEGINE